MATMKKYLLVYREFVGNAFAEAMSFRIHFVLLVLMDLLFYIRTFANSLI